mmetsp:Transcript_5677/g.11263  ORF Transcript_5677/g.11263 Transcript_5677/m.11263 type:complete len:361 (+) Transcript_5677:956-2038(+)
MTLLSVELNDPHLPLIFTLEVCHGVPTLHYCLGRVADSVGILHVKLGRLGGWCVRGSFCCWLRGRLARWGICGLFCWLMCWPPCWCWSWCRSRGRLTRRGIRGLSRWPSTWLMCWLHSRCWLSRRTSGRLACRGIRWCGLTRWRWLSRRASGRLPRWGISGLFRWPSTWLACGPSRGALDGPLEAKLNLVFPLRQTIGRLEAKRGHHDRSLSAVVEPPCTKVFEVGPGIRCTSCNVFTISKRAVRGASTPTVARFSFRIGLFRRGQPHSLVARLVLQVTVNDVLKDLVDEVHEPWAREVRTFFFNIFLYRLYGPVHSSIIDYPFQVEPHPDVKMNPKAFLPGCSVNHLVPQLDLNWAVSR